MTTYIIRRLLQGIVVLVLVTIFVFSVMRLLPGDPLTLYIAQTQIGSLAPDQIAALKHQFGLDQPLVMQYLHWMGGVFTGDLGKSILYNVDVNTLVAERIPVTFHLGILALLISAFFGITFGVICALRRGKWADTVVTILANIGITLPAFWIGILLILGFSLKLHWLPTGGYTSPFQDFWTNTKQIIMPVFVLSLFSVASLTRQTRSSMLEVINQDYIRTAWAKGLGEKAVIIRHAVKNALIPVITQIGLQIGIVVGGAVITETIFNINGMGRLMTSAVFGHDYTVVQAGVLVIALVMVLANLIVDISYGWFDPRIRYG